MSFYDLDKEQRVLLVDQINQDILYDIKTNQLKNIIIYFADEDTYIRKTAYLSIKKIYKNHPELNSLVLSCLNHLLVQQNEKVRQTTINAAGEIGIFQFDLVEHFFDKGLFDDHHIVRNAVIGSIKKMGEKNPKPILIWAKKHLHHPDKEIRREICHGIELRGRTHPEDILPLLQELQHDKAYRVKNTLVHVLGQIAYKKNCLATVIHHLKSWDNKELVTQALTEIIDVHDRYKNFSALSPQEAIEFIERNY